MASVSDSDAPSFRRVMAWAGMAGLILLLAGSIGVNAWIKRTHLQAQLSSVAQDAATALGFALSSAPRVDWVLAGSMADAMFDSGTYADIVIEDVQGTTVVERHARPDRTVPDWFRAWLPLEAPEGRADVVSGWRRLGTVRVRASLEDAYMEMWRTLVSFAGWFAVVALLVLAVLGVLIARLLAPLGRMEEVAGRLADGELDVVWPNPRFRELIRVRDALARMSERLAVIFREQLASIEQLRTQVMQDGVTRLPNRRAFLAQLRIALESLDEGRPGTLVLLRYDDFARFNREEGHAQGDILLSQMGEVIRDVLAPLDGAFAGRLKAAEFALFLTDVPASDIPSQVLSDLLPRLRLCPAFQGRTVERLAAAKVEVGPGLMVVQAMAAADAALEQALSDEVGQDWATGEPEGHGEQVVSATDWRAEIEQALAKEQIDILYQPVLSTMGREVLYQQVVTRLQIEDDELPAARFLPLASRFGLVARLDRHVLRKVVEVLNSDAGLTVGVPLAVDTLRESDFMDWLRRLLTDYPGVGRRLILDVPEPAVLHAWATVDALARERSRLGYALAINRFGGAGQPFGYIQRWRPDWLRLDGALCHRMSSGQDHRFYLESLIMAAHSQDARVIATLVESQSQVDAWRDLGVDGVMGYYLARPQATPVHFA
ncbi:EAL domain-containing protein [Hahella sp. SMD15-11]|uniref:EAL domain-containing protein n=1 Tax=Thermohahella caldifontis TaxID=3142973 RepID=A0AB39UVN8_9GAMM